MSDDMLISMHAHVPVHQVQDFRRHALVVCEQAVSERANSISSAMRYYYPPNLLDYQPRVDPYASEITVSVDYLSSDGTRYRSTIQVHACVYVAFPTLLYSMSPYCRWTWRMTLDQYWNLL